MKTKLTYIAEDGTPFDTEKECVEYEKSINNYVVYYRDKVQTFNDEPSAKRFIAVLLHDCYKNNIISDFKLVHCGKTVEFDSTELSKFVPAHYKIDGNKLNEVFQLSATKNVKIKGYTLHGDYYLADKVIPNKTWEEALKMRKLVILPNGKTVVAHTLSKEELGTIPEEKRKADNWYWTSTPYGGNDAWLVSLDGGFGHIDTSLSYSNVYGGARLGFLNPFI